MIGLYTTKNIEPMMSDNILYLYKYYFIDDGKTLYALQKWILPKRVYFARCLKDDEC